MKYIRFFFDRLSEYQELKYKLRKDYELHRIKTQQEEDNKAQEFFIK